MPDRKITIILSVQDLLTARLEAAGKAMDALRAKTAQMGQTLGASSRAMGATTQRLTQSQKARQDQVGMTNAAIIGIDKPLNTVKKNFADLDPVIKNSGRTMGNFTGLFPTFFPLINVTNTLMGAMALMQGNVMSLAFSMMFLQSAVLPLVIVLYPLIGALKSAIDIQQLKERVREFSHSGDLAKEAWSWIEDFSIKTPFNLTEIESAAEILAKGGLDFRNWMEAAGNLAVNAGVTLSTVASAIVEAAQTGNQKALEQLGITRQMLAAAGAQQIPVRGKGPRGVPPPIGSPEETVMALKTIGTTGDIAGAMARKMLDIPTILGKIGQALQLAFANAGERLLPALVEGLTKVLEALIFLKDNISGFIDKLAPLAPLLQVAPFLALGAAVMFLGGAFKALAFGVAVLDATTGKMVNNTKFLITGLLGLGRTLLSPVVLFSLLAYWLSVVEARTHFFSQALTALVRIIKPVIDFFGNLLQQIKQSDVFVGLLQALKQVEDKLPGAIIGAITGALLGAAVGSLYGGPAGAIAGAVLGAIAGGLIGAQFDNPSAIKDGIGASLALALEGFAVGAVLAGPIGAIVGAIFGFLIGLFFSKDAWDAKAAAFPIESKAWIAAQMGAALGGFVVGFVLGGPLLGIVVAIFAYLVEQFLEASFKDPEGLKKKISAAFEAALNGWQVLQSLGDTLRTIVDDIFIKLVELFIQRPLSEDEKKRVQDKVNTILVLALTGWVVGEALGARLGWKAGGVVGLIFVYLFEQFILFQPEQSETDKITNKIANIITAGVVIGKIVSMLPFKGPAGLLVAIGVALGVAFYEFVIPDDQKEKMSLAMAGWLKGALNFLIEIIKAGGVFAGVFKNLASAVWDAFWQAFRNGPTTIEPTVPTEPPLEEPIFGRGPSVQSINTRALSINTRALGVRQNPLMGDMVTNILSQLQQSFETAQQLPKKLSNSLSNIFADWLKQLIDATTDKVQKGIISGPLSRLVSAIWQSAQQSMAMKDAISQSYTSSPSPIAGRGTPVSSTPSYTSSPSPIAGRGTPVSSTPIMRGNPPPGFIPDIAPANTFQHGGLAIARKPTLAMFGEAGPELGFFAPLKDLLGGGNNNKPSMNITVDMHDNTFVGSDPVTEARIADAVAKRIMGQFSSAGQFSLVRR